MVPARVVLLAESRSVLVGRNHIKPGQLRTKETQRQSHWLCVSTSSILIVCGGMDLLCSQQVIVRDGACRRLLSPSLTHDTSCVE